MKTYSAKPTEVTRKWYVIDASQAPLGRLATIAATILMGKQKPMFTQHIDTGDYVIVINADQLVVTGNKMQDKKYYRHSQYPGSLKESALKDKMAQSSDVSGQGSRGVIEHAIRGMMPDNKLRPGRLARLKVYAGSDHQHEAQKPEIFDIASKAPTKEAK